MKTSYAIFYKQWHRPIRKRFIKSPSSILRAASIGNCCFVSLVYGNFVDLFRQISSNEPNLLIFIYNYFTVVNEWGSPW